MSQPQGNRNGVHGADGATFEQSYSRLQEVVQKLSAGNLSLQEALSAFEEGVTLADKCQQMLEQAELRVRQVSAKAARSGAEAVERLQAASREAPPASAVEAIQIETVQQRVIIDTPPPAPKPQPAAGTSPNALWQGRTTSQPPQRPAQPQGPTQAGEDRYAENLDLDPLFDDED